MPGCPLQFSVFTPQFQQLALTGLLEKKKKKYSSLFLCIFFCLDCTELVNEIVYLYYGGATGRLRRFVPNPPLAPQKKTKKTTSGHQVFCFSLEKLLKVGRREDCDISPAVCSCGRLKAVQRLCVRFNLGFAYDIEPEDYQRKKDTCIHAAPLLVSPRLRGSPRPRLLVT